jgi:phage gp46-like protein
MTVKVLRQRGPRIRNPRRIPPPKFITTASAWNANGVASTSIPGVLAKQSALNADGIAAASFTARGAGQAVLKADGAGTALFAATSPAAFTSDGISTVTFHSFSSSYASLEADGVADVEIQSAGLGIWHADGVAGVAFGEPPSWNADGEADVDFWTATGIIVTGAPIVVPPPLPPGSYTPDIKLFQYTEFPTAFAIDYVLRDNGTLDDTQALATAVVLALGTNRLANATDELPDIDSTDRQGWWGDMDAGEIWGAWPIGSRLWLLKRSKIVGPEAHGGATTTLVEMYINEALQPFIDLKIASEIDVTAIRSGLETITAAITIYRGPRLAIDLQYEILWDELIGSVTMSPPPLGGVLTMTRR